MSKIIIISGATASGKSALALEFAQNKNAAIINADALQIFEGLPILSAQPIKEEQVLAPHFLYSHLKFNESISVGLWLNLVEEIVKKLQSQNTLPIIVGGTGMYISKLIDGISKVPEISLQIKNEARNLYQDLGREEFVEKLLKLGENEEIKSKDKQRLIRLYEVLKQTGKTLKFWQNSSKKTFFNQESFIHINLEINRQKLYENCNLRFQNMFENGAVEEVGALLKKGATNDMQITKTLGFFEIEQFLAQKLDKNAAIELASQKTRNYAKRQLTWFKNQCKNKNVFENKKDALDFLNKI